MKENNLAEPILLKKRTFFEQQAATNSDQERLSLSNLFLIPLKKFRYRLKNCESIKVDYLLIGDNPVLTLLMILLIAKKSNRKTNIAIHFTNENDYWDYHNINQENFKKLIKDEFEILFDNYESFISESIEKLQTSINLCFVNSNNKLFVDYFSFDEFTKNHVFHLTEKPKSDTFRISDYVIANNTIKESFKNLLFTKIIHKFGSRTVKWSLSESSHPVIFSKNVFLTSIPQGWINFTTKSDEHNLYINHEFIDYSFGSASTICHNPANFNDTAINDVKKLINYKF